MVHTEHTTENSRWDLNMGVWSAVTESLREENGVSKLVPGVLLCSQSFHSYKEALATVAMGPSASRES